MENPIKSEAPPDRPSPLPAWDHYHIGKYAEEMIMKELEKHNPDSLLVGLCVGYRVVPADQPEDKLEDDPDNTFYMSHGYMIDCNDEEVRETQLESLPTKEREKSEGLDEGFIDELYEEIKAQILQNVPGDSGEYWVRLEITTAHCSKPKMTCQGRDCRFCSEHHQKHWMRKENKSSTECTWVCTGTPCKQKKAKKK